jgi:hypothetical protein
LFGQTAGFNRERSAPELAFNAVNFTHIYLLTIIATGESDLEEAGRMKFEKARGWRRSLRAGKTDNLDKNPRVQGF